MSAETIGAPRLDSIESLRGVAAFLIVIYHLVELAALPLPGGLGFVRSHFGMGVPLFYALSGFVLAYGYADRLAQGQAQIATFYVRRFFRIAPLFYLVLILWRGVGYLLWSMPVSSQSLILNVSFLFGLVPGEHESLVMAGWSVGVEMLFYLVFPVLLVFLRSVWSTLAGFLLACILSAAVSNALTAAGLAGYAYMNLLTQLPFFIAGMLCYRIWRARSFERSARGWWFLLAGLALAILLVKVPAVYAGLRDLRFGAMHRNVWAIVFLLIIYGSCVANPLVLARGPLRWFGRMSFSAYLLHTIVLVVMIKLGLIVWLTGLGGWSAFLSGSLITLALVCGVSYLSHRWIELPGIALGNRSLAQREGLGNSRQAAEESVVPGASEGFLLRLERWPGWGWGPKLLAGLGLLFVAWVALRHAGQPIIDFHGFRQTQTAITSFWMQQEGWKLAYETPVLGFPWAIPYEFPLYQMLVAGVSSLFGSPLEATGRIVSAAFLLAFAWPAFAINRRLKIGEAFPWIFCALLWSSPLYVFWGRAFLIETAATFFVLASLPFAIDISRGEGGWKSVALYVLLGSLVMMQKATTGGPALLCVWLIAAGAGLLRKPFSVPELVRLAGRLFLLGLPMLAGLGWSAYTETVKAHNAFGTQLGFSVMKDWYLGTMADKLTLETWRLVLWERGLVQNAGGILGLVLLAVPFFGGRQALRQTGLVLACLLLFLLPMLIFTRLHVYHEYYQTANLVFLISALAAVLAGGFPRVGRVRSLSVILLAMLMASNFVVFRNPYSTILERPVEALDPISVRAWEIGNLLRDKTPVGSAIAVYGQDYSSEIPFYAQRKAAVFPVWFKRYREFREHPEAFVGGMPLSAVVVCPPPPGGG